MPDRLHLVFDLRPVVDDLVAPRDQPSPPLRRRIRAEVRRPELGQHHESPALRHGTGHNLAWSTATSMLNVGGSFHSAATLCRFAIERIYERQVCPIR